ncbi:MAG: bfrD [Rariglobus sp.]|jgi:catecholate siderophore receptor|nr:bfrD [Rariglobus sp.]
MHHKSLSAGIALLGTFLSLHSAGFAQSTAQPGDQSVVLDPVEVKGTQSEPYQVKRATIGTRTDTALIDTPQSISVLTESLLDDTATTSIGDAVRYVPGVGTAQGEGNRDTVVLRGNSSTGDYFVDGLRDDVQYYRDFYNIERLEALKGPNGMIFGRGGPGGVINRVTKQAVLDGKSFYEVSALAGSWDQYRSTIDFNQSLSTTVALRLTALYEESDSFRDDVDLRRQGINPTLGWALSEQTTLRIGFEYFNDERVADRGIPSFQGEPLETDESTFFGDPDRSPTHSYMRAVTASLDHKFVNGTTLRNATRYASYDKFYQNVFANGAVTAGTVAIGAYNNATDRENILNQTDVVFDFDTGPIEHKLLTGVELGRQETDNLRLTGSSTPVGITSLGSVPVSNPRYTGPLFFNASTTDANNYSVAENIAVYIQDQIQLLPKLQLIAGLRYDHFEVDFDDRRLISTDLKSNDDLLSPRVGLIYKPVENLALYASYTLSYVPRAGEQLASLSATNAALDPEEFENFEIGAKWDVNPRLSLTAAAYQLDRSNQAITNPIDPTTLILVDGQRVKGIELGASGRITDEWSITGGYAHQNGETRTDSGTTPAGTRIQQLPRNTFSLWNRYDFNSTWGVGLGVIYRDEIFAALPTATPIPATTLPSFVRFDAALFYRFNDHLRAQLNIENIFEKDYYASAHNNNNISPGSPLAFRLGVTARF